MDTPRFYLPAGQWGAVATLSEDESHHAAQVLRLHPGDAVSVFDGAGRAAEATITECAKKRVTLQLGAQISSPKLSARIILAQAIPKGKNMDWIIEKAVELGIAEVFPLLTERTIIRLNAAEASEKQEKWQRSALEACKQCGQTWLPKIHAPQPWKAFLAHLPDTDFRLIAALLPESRKWADLPKNTGKSVLLTIGPEGDFSAAEYRQALEHAFQPWSLGEIILRTETASLYCLSVLRHELGD